MKAEVPDVSRPRTYYGVARFWLRSILIPVVAPVLVLLGVGLEQPGSMEPISLSGILVWLIGLLAVITGLRWLMDFVSDGGHKGGDELAGVSRYGQILFLALQLIFLCLLVPVGPGAAIYWAGAITITYVLLAVLRSSVFLNPAVVVIGLLSFAMILMPAEIFSGGGAVDLFDRSNVCLPAGLNLYGGCLVAELAPAAIALQVVLLVLVHFRRYAPALVVLLSLGGGIWWLGGAGPRLDLLLTLSAVILFFPGQPYRPALSWLLRGSVWTGALVLLTIAGAQTGVVTEIILYPAWLAGLVLSEILAALIRNASPHL